MEGKPERRKTGGEGKRRGRATQAKGNENQFALFKSKGFLRKIFIFTTFHSHVLRDSFLIGINRKYVGFGGCKNEC